MKRLLLCLSLLVFGISVSAQDLSGLTLHSEWRDYQRLQNSPTDGSAAVGASLYLGYVEGVTSAVLLSSGYWKKPEPFKLPPAVSSQEIAAVVGKYLDDHPEKWSLAASGLVFLALRTAFPASG